MNWFSIAFHRSDSMGSCTWIHPHTLLLFSTAAKKSNTGHNSAAATDLEHWVLSNILHIKLTVNVYQVILHPNTDKLRIPGGEFTLAYPWFGSVLMTNCRPVPDSKKCNR